MTMQQKGIIKTWRDDKGFGFISPEDGSKEVFFHVSDISNRTLRPTVNAEVRYQLTYDQQQRPRAIDIRYDAVPMRAIPAATPARLLIVPLMIVGIFFVALALATFIVRLSPLVILLYAGISMVTLVAYQSDKSRATRGERRIPENWLHLLELLGGWPGALIAQSYFRHKTIKSSYQAIYWLIIVLNLILLVVYVVASRSFFL